MPSNTSCHGASHNKKRDFLLWGSVIIVTIFYILHFWQKDNIAQIIYLPIFSHSIFELMNRMSWGLALGVIFVGILDKIPREFIISILGEGGKLSGILRATLAGVLLDLCSHGILFIGMKLYERGASLGQVMAFLIASPWNSISLTLILWSLIGFKWMMLFLLLSLVIAVISGLIFEYLVKHKKLPDNPHKIDIKQDFHFVNEVRKNMVGFKVTPKFFAAILTSGFKDSKPILKWILFGTVLASLIRTFISLEAFQTFFAPTIVGLGFTLIVATIMEVCSEGSIPIASDIFLKANAPGNSFAFLMTGVSTDYTEIMAIKETTKSWRISLFLPLITVPQVILMGYFINHF